jgi:hypothetical protein
MSASSLRNKVQTDCLHSRVFKDDMIQYVYTKNAVNNNGKK